MGKRKTFVEEEDREEAFKALNVMDLNDTDELNWQTKEEDSDTDPNTDGSGEEDDEEEVVQKNTPLQELMSWVIPILIAVLVALILKNYVVINATVPSGSMLNTIYEGDNLLGFRLAYQFSEPERGDIIIFKYPDDESKLFIKRIIGLPGETVVIQDGLIYIDGAEEPLEEDYLPEEWVSYTGPYEFEVPEDSYLVLGDNRNDSWDARRWTNTYVTSDKIIGKAMFVYYPFSHMRWL